MTITKHHYRTNTYRYYYKVGSMEVDEGDAMDFWVLMCGEDAVRQFLKKCEREREGSRQVVPELKRTEQ